MPTSPNAGQSPGAEQSHDRGSTEGAATARSVRTLLLGPTRSPKTREASVACSGRLRFRGSHTTQGVAMKHVLVRALKSAAIVFAIIAFLDYATGPPTAENVVVIPLEIAVAVFVVVAAVGFVALRVRIALDRRANGINSPAWRELDAFEANGMVLDTDWDDAATIEEVLERCRKRQERLPK